MVDLLSYYYDYLILLPLWYFITQTYKRGAKKALYLGLFADSVIGCCLVHWLSYG